MASRGPPSTDGRRRFGVVLAPRWPLTSVEPFPDAPWPERTLDVAIAHPVRGIRVLAIYAPLGRHDTTKSETFEAAGRIIERVSGPLIDPETASFITRSLRLPLPRREATHRGRRWVSWW